MLCRGLQSKCKSNLIYLYYGSSSIDNNIHYRSFCAQQKLHKEQLQDITEELHENSDSNINDLNEAEFEDKVIQLTPQQKIREWTRMYHQIQGSKWIKQNLGKYINII